MQEPTSFAQQLSGWQQRIENFLDQQLSTSPQDCGQLNQAMRYSALGAGKRLRPVLVYATAEAINLPIEQADAIAAAIEMVHAYSLVHDDLPAMDDDDLRRGRPTCHIKYGDATAILAGDALQALAFDVLAKSPLAQSQAVTTVKLISELAQAAGGQGMAGGQQLDLDAEQTGAETNIDGLERIHRLKTGALIAACATMPAIAAGLSGEKTQRLKHFASQIGLAFQVHDDVLDITADTATLGKTQGADQARGKATYPSLIGLAESEQLAIELRDDALAALADFGDAADSLRQLARHMVERKH